jgi:hypothetical protein
MQHFSAVEVRCSNVSGLRALNQHPNLVHRHVAFEGGNDFRNPTLLEFFAPASRSPWHSASEHRWGDPGDSRWRREPIRAERDAHSGRRAYLGSSEQRLPLQ